ncbi:hypothetical protein [Paenibacillus sp. Y412MC10]|uniref:hypothetical protein n=1 Tax=Geobacillus sp. (strain Y412MC10) TaxID=481743 RepID=UPI0011AB45B3|nr:hypothetical protein [Paenibacillus sp. Y412MC10]
MRQDRLKNLQFQKDQIEQDLKLSISEAGRATLLKERERLDEIITCVSNNKPEPAEFSMKTPVGEISVYTNDDDPYHGIFVNINGQQAALIEHHGDDLVHKIHVWKQGEENDGEDPVVAVIFETGQLQEG